MIESHMSLHLQDSIEILEQLAASKNWQFLLRTLKKYIICYDFLAEERDDLYLDFWRLVEANINVNMAQELSLVNDDWLTGHSEDFRSRTNARLGAFLRASKCCDDFTVSLTLGELDLLKSWREEHWLLHISHQLEDIYEMRMMLPAECTKDCYNFTRGTGNVVFLRSFGHELFHAQLLEVTNPMFIKFLDLTEDRSLRARFNFAKKLLKTCAGSSCESVH